MEVAELSLTDDVCDKQHQLAHLKGLLKSQTYTKHAKYCSVVYESSESESDDSESSNEEQELQDVLIIDDQQKHYYDTNEDLQHQNCDKSYKKALKNCRKVLKNDIEHWKIGSGKNSLFKAYGKAISMSQKK